MVSTFGTSLIWQQGVLDLIQSTLGLVFADYIELSPSLASKNVIHLISVDHMVMPEVHGLLLCCSEEAACVTHAFSDKTV